MSVATERHEGHWLIRLEGEFTVTSAAELNGALIEGLASGKDMQLDLESVSEIDITVMQLLWAAGREAARTGAGLAIRVSETAGMAARAAGFERFPGTAVEG